MWAELVQRHNICTTSTGQWKLKTESTVLVSSPNDVLANLTVSTKLAPQPMNPDLQLPSQMFACWVWMQGFSLCFWGAYVETVGLRSVGTTYPILIFVRKKLSRAATIMFSAVGSLCINSMISPYNVTDPKILSEIDWKILMAVTIGHLLLERWQQLSSLDLDLKLHFCSYKDDY